MHKYKSLTPSLLRILKEKGTEKPFSSSYKDTVISGSYLCRGCGAALFRASNQFASQCGWPSFDDEISDTIRHVPDSDGIRTEIVCANCFGHLGHVFFGEGFTENNIRHCVNGLSIEFVSSETVIKTEEAIVAGGCFWGVEYLFRTLPGVLVTEVGYIGGEMQAPNYHAVCAGNSGHVEGVRVLFDANILTYDDIVKYFFEIHDPTQVNGQGPDIGAQYASCLFTFNDEQKIKAAALIEQLCEKGFSIATKLLPISIFWPAEDLHQLYYEKNKHTPYCHFHKKRF